MTAPGPAGADRDRQPPAVDLDAAIARACARIAPTWPLDRWIAVNPLWGLIDRPLPEVAAALHAQAGAQLLMPRAWYREAYRAGRLRDEHLAAAIANSGAPCSLPHLRGLLDREPPRVTPRPRVVDVVDAGRDLSRALAWRGFVTHDVSQLCAAYFDEGQAQLGPDRGGGLYACWRRHAMADRSPALLMGATTLRRHAAALPATADALIAAALAALEVPVPEREAYLWGLLLDQQGWASWCAYRRWTARLAGADDPAITELLAIRLAWEWLLYRAGGEAVARRWRLAIATWPQIDAAAAAARADDWLLQDAMEIAWRAPVLRALPAGVRAPRPTRPAVQAVFCIDVRSEVVRRALEAVAPAVQTLGFAGFFGIPMDYRPHGAPAARPQLPGLLAPRLRAADAGLDGTAAARRAQQHDLAAAWTAFKTDPLGTFTFVEALGLTSAVALLGEALGQGRPARLDHVGLSAAQVAARQPRLIATSDGAPLALDARCQLAAAMLRGMSLTRDFARVVMLAGHGSSTRNNPHAAGLDCGACGGQTGEVNARAAAALLNDPEVRAGLARQGVELPSHTWFVAALHDTTADELTLFELDLVPPSHRADVEALRGWLAEAGARTRRARAGRLGLTDVAPAGLERAVRARTTDWAQVRAEWGLAGNAALIVAPREHCRHLDLAGRAFLHEYRHREDEGYRVLESIMTAPMVVAHWINLQYYASTVDNGRFGSGTKVLHNVVGAHLGVFEGNGGDLRIGLPLQSLHDGSAWVHEPLRLTVIIEAPRAAIDAVLARHAQVRALVANGWLALYQLDDTDGTVAAWRADRWHAEPSPP